MIPTPMAVYAGQHRIGEIDDEYEAHAIAPGIYRFYLPRP
jgi:hypothetical protein